MSRLPLTLGVAAGVVALDQVTKAIAVATLEGEPSIPVLGEWLQLTFVRNPGAAFSLAGGYTVIISGLAMVVSFFIVRTARTLTNVWWAIVLGGILGGALGNLVDRVLRAPGPLRGHVVDFLELPNWPVFNVADMALVGSAILAVVLSLRGVDMGEVSSGADAGEPAERADAIDGGPGHAAVPDDAVHADGTDGSAAPASGAVGPADPDRADG